MDVSIFQGTWLVSIVFPCVIHVAFLASVIHCLAAASRPRPAQRKKLRPVDPKTLETSNDGVYAASPASHDPDMAIMFVGPRAEAREWSDEVRSARQRGQVGAKSSCKRSIVPGRWATLRAEFTSSLAGENRCGKHTR
mmetsp:Transcript_15645/g.59478  ORF Transcript_15645/g.59478 Transcript_15645/m.59478 type:complete len:138 (+) Transcript_15645:53-466(+)|eukprot:scaffold1289_cov274-Pinguiococcus_pyrenoidosus.AAC.7